MNKTILIVIGLACAGLGVALFMPMNKNKSKKAITLADIAMLESALEMYKEDKGAFPTTEQGLIALTRKTGASKYYLPDKYLIDPWKSPYVYRCPGLHNTQGFDIYSLGPDKKESADDINSWTDYKPNYKTVQANDSSLLFYSIILIITIIVGLIGVIVGLIGDTKKHPRDRS